MSSAASITVTSPPDHGRIATFIAFLREELKPHPGRLAVALRITASAVLVLWVGMTFDLPALGIALYLVFMVPRDSPAKAIKVWVLIAITGALAVAYTEIIVSLPGDGAAIRFAGGAFIIFIGIFMMQAATIGPPWMLLGLLSDVLIRAWDHRLPAERNLESNLWVWLAFVTGIGGGVVIELLFGRRDSLKALRAELSDSLQTVAHALSNWQQGKEDPVTQKKLDGLSLKGASAQYELLNDAQSRYLDPSGVGIELQETIQLVLFLIDQVAAFQARDSRLLTEEDRATIPTSAKWRPRSRSRSVCFYIVRGDR